MVIIHTGFELSGLKFLRGLLALAFLLIFEIGIPLLILKISFRIQINIFKVGHLIDPL